jgi:D-serine deaminase-like pyridoxal phosphate-dependent protein
VPKDCPALQVGDPVIFQHAKAGELCERFSNLLLLHNGKAVERVLTYRGEGQTFL